MRRVYTLLAVALLVVSCPMSASPEDPNCIASGVVIHAFDSPADQLQQLERIMLENGVTSVQTVTLAKSAPIGARYLLVARYCDAFGYIDPSQGKRRAVSHSIVIPDDHPYQWSEHSTAIDAAAAYDAHADAKVRGITTIAGGTFVVFWSRE